MGSSNKGNNNAFPPSTQKRNLIFSCILSQIPLVCFTVHLKITNNFKDFCSISISVQIVLPSPYTMYVSKSRIENLHRTSIVDEAFPNSREYTILSRFKKHCIHDSVAFTTSIMTVCVSISPLDYKLINKRNSNIFNLYTFTK